MYRKIFLLTMIKHSRIIFRNFDIIFEHLLTSDQFYHKKFRNAVLIISCSKNTLQNTFL